MNQRSATKQRYASSRCPCESERRGWGAKERESPGGNKAALPEAHVNQIRSKDMMSVYRETGQAGPGSSGSRVLIIPRRKSGIGLQWKVRRSELAQQPSPLAGTARLLSGVFVILWKWGRTSPVQRVQPSQVSTGGMLSCRELRGILGLRVGACSAVGSCGSVSTRGDVSLHVFWGKEETHITHLCNALFKKKPTACI